MEISETEKNYLLQLCRKLEEILVEMHRIEVQDEARRALSLVLEIRRRLEKD